ncbi:MFS family permease [Robbsia andropogonis]|uniref:MFS transporter n=1 Tax=Robbsia andropogonis TaxID=28092 RepID=UPI003D209825
MTQEVTRFSPLKGAFLSVWALRCCATLGNQMLAFALGLRLYEVSGSALDLGLLGLIQFVPSLAFALPAGQLVDRFSPGRVASFAQWLNALAAGALLLPIQSGSGATVLLFGAALATGATRAFEHPINTTLLPSVVANRDVPRAIAWITSIAKIASMVGPVIGGGLYAFAPTAAYSAAFALFVIAAILAATLLNRSDTPTHLSGLRPSFAGLHLIWRDRVLGGAMLLDLFAVLLGGATALLPIYALDVLRVGPMELGLLRAAPGIGAVVTGLWLTRSPVTRHVGVVLLGATALFGVLTVAFGLARSLPISLLLLAAIGATDMVSIHIRSALVQLRTPATLRGRVGAVNGIFISSSNQIGAFESGLTAYWFGTVPAIVLGGAATVAVVGLIATLVAPLRRAKHIQDAPPTNAIV